LEEAEDSWPGTLLNLPEAATVLAISVEAASKDIESYSEVWSSQEG